MSTSSTTSKFVKKLASNDKKVRDSAIANLKLYLSSKNSNQLDLFQFEKLWKGLYYSVWFCDRVKTQTKLCENLASIYSTTLINQPASSFINFFHAFNNIIIKEWPSIDQWRIDKFYMLIRKILNHNFRYLKLKSWDDDIIDQWLQVLNTTLLSGDSKVPLALPYHLCDIYLDELQKVIFEDIIKENPEISDEEVIELVAQVPVLKLISSFENLSKSAQLKTLREKCKEEVLDDKRLKDWKVVSTKEEASEDEGSDDEDEWKGFN